MKFMMLFLLVISLSGFQFQSNENVYHLDSGHTYIGFDVERFLVGEVTGRFNDFSGSVNMTNGDLTSIKINATIQTKSLDTNNETRDNHLKGEMWLNVSEYPQIKLVSTEIKKTADGFLMSGNLTIKEVTNQINFPLIVKGPFKDPTKKVALGLSADLVINRFDYDIKFNQKMDNGSFFIGDEVKIKLRALAYAD